MVGAAGPSPGAGILGTVPSNADLATCGAGRPAVTRGVVMRYLPLLGHVVPTVAIGFGWVIPRSCIAGWNPLTIGFGVSVVSTIVAYVLGQRATVSCARDGNCRVAQT
jgi:hypothetical protein